MRYRNRWGAAFFAKRPSEIQQRKYTILERVGTFAEGPRKVPRSPAYLDTLTESSFGEFLQFVQYTFESEESLIEEANRTLWNPIINAGDEMCDERERDTERARYKSRRRLLTEDLENHGDRVWAKGSPAAIDVWLG